MSPGPNSDDRLDLVQQVEIDQLCNRFETAWKAGDEPVIESFLEGLKQVSRPAAFVDLLRVELELIRSAGGEPTLRTIAQEKLEGCTNQEIADELGVSTHTVIRKLIRIRQEWEKAQVEDESIDT